MRRFHQSAAAGIVLTLTLGLGAFGSGAAAQDRGGIPDVIRKQMQAFSSGDLEGAFGFASPGIRQLFGTPGQFGDMVRRGYPMVWQPGDVRFGLLDGEGGRYWQRVFVTDGAGAVHALDYLMEPVDGEWRIAGVRPAPPVGAGV